MSKKQKRQTSQATPRAETVERPTPTVTPRSRSSDFNPDYSYVISDLKRIATLAGSAIAILIVLSFFLR